MHPLRGFLLLLALPLCACLAPASQAPTVGPSAADVASPAYKACRAAIAAQTGHSEAEVEIFDDLASEANTRILARIPGGEAPWRCLSSARGLVTEVIYTGSEGAL